VSAGARRDMGQLDAAVVALQIPELDPRRRDPWSARLFYAYADNLAATGREEEAIRWFLNAAEADDDGDTDAAERAVELSGGDTVELTDGDPAGSGPDTADSDASEVDTGDADTGDSDGGDLDGEQAGAGDADVVDVVAAGDVDVVDGVDDVDRADDVADDVDGADGVGQVGGGDLPVAEPVAAEPDRAESASAEPERAESVAAEPVSGRASGGESAEAADQEAAVGGVRAAGAGDER
jgi:hypothetical protein